jgi:hypothetical protein
MAGDHLVHQAETRALLEHLIRGQHWIAGWNFDEFAGYPLYLYHYVLGPWLVGLTSWSTGIPLWITYKFWFFVSFFLAGIGVYHRVRSHGGTSALWPGLCACLFLLTSQLAKNHALGMWNYTLAMGLLAWFWLAVEGLVERPRAATFAATTLLTFLTILAHPYVALSACLIGAMVFALHAPATGSVGAAAARLAGAALLGAGLASGYIIPFLTMRGWGAPPVWQNNPPLAPLDYVYQFLRGLLSLTPGHASTTDSFLEYYLWAPAASLAAAALLMPAARIAVAARGAGPRTARTALAVFLVLCIFQSQWWRGLKLYDPKGTFLENLLDAQRLMPVLWLSAMVLVGATVPALDTRLRRACSVLAVAGIVASAAWFVATPQPEQTTESRTGPLYRDLRAGMEYLRNNAGRIAGRVAVQNTAGNPTVAMLSGDTWMLFSHPFAELPEFAGVPVFGGWCAGWLYPTSKYAMTEYGFFLGAPAPGRDAKEWKQLLTDFDIGALFIQKGYLFDRLKQAQLVGETMWEGRDYVIASTDTSRSGYLQSRGGALRVDSVALLEASVTADFQTSAPDASLLLSVSHHPCWMATLDGAPITLQKTAAGLTAFTVPAPGAHKLEMTFSPPRWVPMTCSLGALLALAIAWIRWSRAPPASGGPPPTGTSSTPRS